MSADIKTTLVALKAIEQGPRRCRDCFLPVNLCGCNEVCEDYECECHDGEYSDDLHDL